MSASTDLSYYIYDILYILSAVYTHIGKLGCRHPHLGLIEFVANADMRVGPNALQVEHEDTELYTSVAKFSNRRLHAFEFVAVTAWISIAPQVTCMRDININI